VLATPTLRGHVRGSNKANLGLGHFFFISVLFCTGRRRRHNRTFLLFTLLALIQYVVGLLLDPLCFFR